MVGLHDEKRLEADKKQVGKIVEGYLKVIQVAGMFVL